MFLTLLFASLAFFCYYHLVHKRRNLPHGPTPLPLVGNALTMLPYRGNLDQLFIKWRKAFGDSYTFWIGETPIVVVSGYKKITELFQHDDGRFAGRFNFDQENNLMRGGQVAGVLRTDGPMWQEQRRFILRVFRDFGLGKNLMQERILNEVADLIETVDADIKRGVEEHNMREHIECKVGSVINSLLFGYRFDKSRMGEFRTLKSLMSEYVQMAGDTIFIMAQSNSKLFLNVPKMRKHVDSVQAHSAKLIEFFERQISEHEKQCNLEGDDEPTDFVEAYLRKQRVAEDAYYNRYQLRHVIFDLWLAGQETTSNVLGWSLIYLIENPEAQTRMQAEMDRVVGSDRLITVADRAKLPYTCAVVNECLRLANILALNLMHRLMADTRIDGVLVKKGTCILPQICTVLYDEEIFPEPRKFRPERFLDSNGQLKRSDELLAFSIGKRQCLGEGLARMELHLFLANIFHHYKVTAGEVKPNPERRLGGTIFPSPFTCRVEKRFA